MFSDWREQQKLVKYYIPWAVYAGYRANFLMNFYLEKHLDEPIDTIRHRLNIVLPPVIRKSGKKTKWSTFYVSWSIVFSSGVSSHSLLYPVVVTVAAYLKQRGVEHCRIPYWGGSMKASSRLSKICGNFTSVTLSRALDCCGEKEMVIKGDFRL